MRGLPLLLVVLTLALPEGRAASDTLRLDGPDAIEGSTQGVVLDIELTVSDFACSQERTFTVLLQAAGDPGIEVILPERVYITAPPGAYVTEPFTIKTHVGMDVVASATGSIAVIGTFEAEEGDCIAPGGFPTSQASAVVAVTAPAPVEPTPPANDTETPPDAGAEVPTPTPTPSEPPVCAPPAICEVIGDYPGNAGGDTTRAVPFPAALALLGAAVALLARKR